MSVVVKVKPASDLDALPAAGRRNVRLSTWLSIIPGLGQIYNRQPKRAAIFFFVVIGLFLTSLNIPGATSQLLASGKSAESVTGPATVTAITYDPNRSARIAVLTFAGGEKRYIIAPAGLTVGQRVQSGPDTGAGTGYALLSLFIEMLSTLIFMATFLLALTFWYNAMHDARRTAQEVNGERAQGGRWWWFHR